MRGRLAVRLRIGTTQDAAALNSGFSAVIVRAVDELLATGERFGAGAMMSGMRSIELFAGGGGLALGTSKAGFEHEAVIEWDSNACRTLRRNAGSGSGHVGNWRVVETDVKAYDFRQHDGIDFIFGGPPCQPFSLGGKHRGHEDERNMFPEAVRAIRELRPKAFIFENVKGLLRRNFTNYYSYILHQLRFPLMKRRGDEEWTDHLARLERRYTSGKEDDFSYRVVPRLLNAADFGVPQRRERIFVVGIRSDLGVEFSFPDPTYESAALEYAQWVSGEYWERHRVPKSRRPKPPKSLPMVYGDGLLQPWRTVRDAISDLPRISMGQTSSKVANHFYNPGARSYHGHTGSPYDEPAKTLKAGDHGVPGGENTLQLEDGSVRYFSVRECARIQTFPDEWIFEGSWTESMRQLGNAVPVDLACVVAERLKQTIKDAEAGAADNVRQCRA